MTAHGSIRGYLRLINVICEISMNMKRLLFFAFAAVMLAGCSPKIVSNLTSAHQALPQDAEVVVLGPETPGPDNAELLGQIKIGDSGFTTKNGTYPEVLELAKEEARKAGGNVVKVVEHKGPDMVSSIHRITAQILRVEDVASLDEAEDVQTVSSHPDYAVIYFYRDAGTGPLVTYDVHVGETKVYRSKVNTKAEVKIYEEGEVEVWARTEAKEILPLTVKKGRDYYVRTGVTIGIMVGRPSFDLVPAESGRTEYELIKDR